MLVLADSEAHPVSCTTFTRSVLGIKHPVYDADHSFQHEGQEWVRVMPLPPLCACVSMSWDELDILRLQMMGSKNDCASWTLFLSRNNCILPKLVSVQNVLFSLSLSEVQAKLRGTFARLTAALQAREKQLLRQVEVLHSQQVALLQSQSSVPSSSIT